MTSEGPAAKEELTFESVLFPAPALILVAFLSNSHSLRTQVIAGVVVLVTCVGLYFAIKRERKGVVYLIIATILAIRNWLYEPTMIDWWSIIFILGFGIASMLIIAKYLKLGWKHTVSPPCLLGFFVSATLLLPSIKK